MENEAITMENSLVFFQINIELMHNISMALLYIYPGNKSTCPHKKKLYMNIYTSKIHNRQNVDTNVHQFMSGLTNVPYPYNAI